ncbi:MAG: hypothetical protein ACK45H_01875 [Bacteroidota bacterium]|jgi:hypothetical protein
MKGLKGAVALFVFGGMMVSSCVKHEIIPAPEAVVDLNCYFQGFINGTDVELTQNVNGYTCNPTKEKIIVPAPEYSSAIYYAEMSSATTPIFIKVGMGSVMWDAATVQDPTLTLFNNFFLNNLNPAYSDDATAGFEVQYRDNAGNIWLSHENSVNAQNVVFSNIKQESDAYGDYSAFTCAFNCYVYKQDQTTMAWDSIQIQNAVYKGWFKR